MLTALGIALAVEGIALTFWFLLGGMSPAIPWVTALVIALVVLVGVALGSLTVTVTDTTIVVAFGAGWVHRTIPLSIVRGAAPVRNSFWWGWGIRWTPYGWMWNVSGFDAVEITYASGKKFRIGTNQPMELTAAINAAIGTAPGP